MIMRRYFVSIEWLNGETVAGYSNSIIGFRSLFRDPGILQEVIEIARKRSGRQGYNANVISFNRI